MRAFCVGVVIVCAAGVGCPVDDPPPADPGCPAGQSGDPCAFPWEATCDGVVDDGCVAGTPTRCTVNDPAAVPAYDCSTCGCASLQACVDTGVGDLCLDADVREGERDDDVIDDGLQDEDHLALFRRLHENDALSLDDVLQRLALRRAADPRRSLVVLGSDEPDVAALVAPFFDGNFGAVVAADDACSDVDVGLLPNDQRVLTTAADRATDVTCLHPGVFARCTFPSVAGCAVMAGLLPETIVLLGRTAIGDVDNALLRRAARAGRDEWLPRFDAELGLFSEVFLNNEGDGGFAHPDLPGTLRFIVDDDHDDVVFGVFEGVVTAAQLRAFRTLWVNANIQQFLTVFDITPSQCTFDVAIDDSGAGDDVVDIDCSKNGARISGPVRLGDNDLSGLTLVAP